MEFNEDGVAKPGDVGTRYQHLADLLDMWRSGLVILKRMNVSYSTPTDLSREAQLENAILMLEKFVDTLTGYKGEYYDLKKMVEDISKDPARIEGGRGTPLKETA